MPFNFSAWDFESLYGDTLLPATALLDDSGKESL
jgi:hypothetical protein